MTKFLLLIALAVLACWFWRQARVFRRKPPPPEQTLVEPMVACARCGVNQPLSESIRANGRYYCSAAHLPGDQSDAS